MRYFARFEPDEGGGWIVAFPDVPEAITGGRDDSEAMENAVDALEIVLLTYLQDRTPFPAASAHDGRPVSISAAVAVKIALIEAFRKSGMTGVALAERLGKRDTEIRRMLDPFHNTKLGSMETALQALGKELVVSVRDAA